MCMLGQRDGHTAIQTESGLRQGRWPLLSRQSGACRSKHTIACGHGACMGAKRCLPAASLRAALLAATAACFSALDSCWRCFCASTRFAVNSRALTACLTLARLHVFSTYSGRCSGAHRVGGLQTTEKNGLVVESVQYPPVSLLGCQQDVLEDRLLHLFVGAAEQALLKNLLQLLQCCQPYASVCQSRGYVGLLVPVQQQLLWRIIVAAAGAGGVRPIAAVTAAWPVCPSPPVLSHHVGTGDSS